MSTPEDPKEVDSEPDEADDRQRPALGDEVPGAGQQFLASPDTPEAHSSGRGEAEAGQPEIRARSGEGHRRGLDDSQDDVPDDEDDDEAIEGEIVPTPEARAAAELIVAAIQTSQSSYWSGMLPRPEEFAKYPSHVQDRMLSWNDAWTTDESARQDKLVDAEIEAARVGPKRAIYLAVGCGAVSATFFAIGNPTAGIAFIAAPVLAFAAQFINNVRSRSSRPEGESSPPAITRADADEDPSA